MSQEIIRSTKPPSKHIVDVSSQEIVQIVINWLESNNIHNVLPKTPNFEASISNYYIDLCLENYQQDKKLKTIGQVVINKKTNKIVAHTPMDNLLRNISSQNVTAVTNEQDNKQFLELWREEQQWIDDHRNEYAGQWVAVKGSNLISHSHNSKVVFEEANKSGIKQALIVLVESEKEIPVGGW